MIDFGGFVGVAAAVTVEAMQAVGVQATIKHYILNEQELHRTTLSSSVDDKSMVGLLFQLMTHATIEMDN